MMTVREVHELHKRLRRGYVKKGRLVRLPESVTRDDLLALEAHQRAIHNISLKTGEEVWYIKPVPRPTPWSLINNDSHRSRSFTSERELRKYAGDHGMEIKRSPTDSRCFYTESVQYVPGNR